MKFANFRLAFLAAALWVVTAAPAPAADPQAVTTRYVIKGNPHAPPTRPIYFRMNYYSRDQAETRFLPHTIDFLVTWWWDLGLNQTKENGLYMASGTMMEFFWSEDVDPRVWRPSNPPVLPVIDGGSYDDPSRWIWVADDNIDTDIIFDKTPLKSEPHYYVVASLSNPAAFNNTYQWGLVGDTLGCSLSQQVRGSEIVAIISGGKDILPFGQCRPEALVAMLISHYRCK